MSNPYAQFGTSEDLEIEGVWLRYSGFRIKVRRAGGKNSKYERELTRALRPVRKQASAGTLEPEVIREILLKVFAKTVVIGWETTHDDDGKKLEAPVPTVMGPDGPMPYNVQNAIRFFGDLPDLFDDVRESAAEMTHFKKDEMEVAAGN